MATIEILAAFALSLLFMLLLWSLRDLLLRPRRTEEKPLKLALFFEAEDDRKARGEQRPAAPDSAADPFSAEAGRIIQNIRSDAYDGGNGKQNTDLRHDTPARFSK